MESLYPFRHKFCWKMELILKFLQFLHHFWGNEGREPSLSWVSGGGVGLHNHACLPFVYEAVVLCPVIFVCAWSKQIFSSNSFLFMDFFTDERFQFVFLVVKKLILSVYIWQSGRLCLEDGLDFRLFQNWSWALAHFWSKSFKVCALYI